MSGGEYYQRPDVAAPKPAPKKHGGRCVCGGEYKKGRLKAGSGHVSALRCSSCHETYVSTTALVALVLEPFDEER